MGKKKDTSDGEVEVIPFVPDQHAVDLMKDNGGIQSGGTRRRRKQAGDQVDTTVVIPKINRDSPKSPKRTTNTQTSPVNQKIPTTYMVSSWMFSRGMGLLYFITFFFIYQEIHGLIGSSGVSPLSLFLNRVRNSGETQLHVTYWMFPSVFWIDSSDKAIDYVCWIGMISSAGIFFDIFASLNTVISWIMFLSICSVGQEFFLHRQDLLLLECGFLLMFFLWPTWNYQLRRPVCRRPDSFILWCFRILLFRILFVQGYVHFFGVSEFWRNWSFFDFFFESQPFPTPLSWHLHFAPSYIHEGLIIFVLTMETLMPFLIFFNTISRKISVFYLSIFQIFFILIGNNGIWNWLLLLLNVLQLEDAFWERIPIISSIFFVSATPPSKPDKRKKKSKQPRRRTNRWKYLCFIVLIFYLTLSLLPLTAVTKDHVKTPNQLISTYKLFHSLRIANIYTEPVMSYPRRGFSIQGSMDAHVWEEYEYKFSPDFRLNQEPSWNVIFFPRLEFRLFTSAQSEYEKEIWYEDYICKN